MLVTRHGHEYANGAVKREEVFWVLWRFPIDSVRLHMIIYNSYNSTSIKTKTAAYIYSCLKLKFNLLQTIYYMFICCLHRW